MSKSLQSLCFAGCKNYPLASGLSIGLLLLVALSWPTSAWAHGSGTLRLTNVAMGPFRVTVWTSPEPPRVGELHIAVAICPLVDSARAGSTPADLTVQIQMTALENQKLPIIEETAKQVTFSQEYYEGYFTVATTGQWQVEIRVKAADKVESLQFGLEVLPRQVVDWESVFWITLLLIAVLWAVRVTRSTSTPP